MGYKTILVHIDAGKRWPARVHAAIGMARLYDAHLVGLNAMTSVELPGYVVAATGGASVLDIQKRFVSEQAARAEAEFNKVISAAGLAAEWRSSELDAADAVTLHGRYADLLVIGQPWAKDNAGIGGDFVERVIFEAGRPVLMIPYVGKFDVIGKRVLIGWNASREATRAITDAISVLQQADMVQVIVINPIAGEHGAIPGSDIALYLSRHGVKVEVFTDHSKNIDVGNEMLSRAADFGADLIVMGAYGHSRFREMLLGGASRTIIESMTVPVLLSN